MTNCPFCGWEFDFTEENCHTGCPLNSKCNMIKCPACGYKFINESQTIEVIRSLLNRKEKKKSEVSSES